MIKLPPLLYRGSVKNVRGEVSAESLLFEFSDRYSVFDWGEMPDLLSGKGAALAIMGKSFFQYLENPKNWENLFSSEIINKTFSSDYLFNLKETALFKKYCESGLNHHALLNDETYAWNSPYLKVKNVSILKPTLTDDQSYQYFAYRDKPVNTLVPLEVIFRIGLSEGNSLSKRLGNNQNLWKEFGFNETPTGGSLLKKPVIDFSTKLERGDRYLSYTEACDIAGLNSKEWTELHQMTHLIALNLFHFHHMIGLELWDGKIEVAFTKNPDGTRSFMLVDSIGIDELRLLYKGKSFSKEFLRESYKNSDWYKNLEAAKKDSLLTGVDFKDICLNHYHSGPLKLDPEVKLRAESVYKSYCNSVSAFLGHELNFNAEFDLDNYALRYL
ncbi:MAG: phosphoribosylaminoimidazolesuccinocarboxamide synthase [Bacteriovorax sp.]|nr:phosphoribosylaminoimidazolesuccinocarboxamide synthase [Bacteriovorax sp.]